MSLDQSVVKNELKKFNVADSLIAQMETDYYALTINGLADKEGYEQVRKARGLVRDLRGSIEDKRKELKADSLAYGRAIDAEAKRITDLIYPIEEHLVNQIKTIDDEKERIRKEKEEARYAELRKKIEEEQAIRLAEENARLEEIRKAQEEAQRLIEQKKKEFQDMVARKQEELRKREVRIEAEKIVQESCQFSNNGIKVVQERAMQTQSPSAPPDLKERLIKKFFEPFDENEPNHVFANSKESHWLYDKRYIVKPEFLQKDIIEYILDEICNPEVEE